MNIQNINHGCLLQSASIVSIRTKEPSTVASTETKNLCHHKLNFTSPAVHDCNFYLQSILLGTLLQHETPIPVELLTQKGQAISFSKSMEPRAKLRRQRAVSNAHPQNTKTKQPQTLKSLDLLHSTSKSKHTAWHGYLLNIKRPFLVTCFPGRWHNSVCKNLSYSLGSGRSIGQNGLASGTHVCILLLTYEKCKISKACIHPPLSHTV